MRAIGTFDRSGVAGEHSEEEGEGGQRDDDNIRDVGYAARGRVEILYQDNLSCKVSQRSLSSLDGQNLPSLRQPRLG